ncbi:hypothetical protein ACFL4T_01840 [candidate division KSB1 bacterium]
MRYFLILLLSLALVFTFCSKKSTDSTEEEDKITLEITVKENGAAVQNLFVIVEAKVQESVKNRAEGDEVISYETTQTDQITTTVYGKATFNYSNKSLPNDGGIFITKVTIKRLNDVLLEDDVEKFIESGNSLSLDYEL